MLYRGPSYPSYPSYPAYDGVLQVPTLLQYRATPPSWEAIPPGATPAAGILPRVQGIHSRAATTRTIRPGRRWLADTTGRLAAIQWYRREDIRAMTKGGIGRLEVMAGHLEDMAGRLEDMAGRLEDMEGHLEDMEGRLEVMAGRREDMAGRLEDMAGRLEDMDGRLEVMEGRLEVMEGRLEDMAGRLDIYIIIIFYHV
jgi:hypothetical protein